MFSDFGGARKRMSFLGRVFCAGGGARRREAKAKVEEKKSVPKARKAASRKQNYV